VAGKEFSGKKNERDYNNVINIPTVMNNLSSKENICLSTTVEKVNRYSWW